MSDGSATNPIAELRAAAESYLEWSDAAKLEDEGILGAVSRSSGLQRMADYVHNLAAVARLSPDIVGRDLEPARRIALALHDAGSGFANPLFRHETAIQKLAEIRWGGRKPPSRLYMEGRAVGCAWFLVRHAGVTVKRACGFVATSFGVFGHKGRKGGELSGKTISKWFDELVADVSESADEQEQSGWARVEGIADLTRQCEAIKTANQLMKRHSQEAKLDWFNAEVWTLAASCAVTPSATVMTLSHYPGM